MGERKEWIDSLEKLRQQNDRVCATSTGNLQDQENNNHCFPDITKQGYECKRNEYKHQTNEQAEDDKPNRVHHIDIKNDYIAQCHNECLQQPDGDKCEQFAEIPFPAG